MNQYKKELDYVFGVYCHFKV